MIDGFEHQPEFYNMLEDLKLGDKTAAVEFASNLKGVSDGLNTIGCTILETGTADIDPAIIAELCIIAAGMMKGAVEVITIATT